MPERENLLNKFNFDNDAKRNLDLLCIILIIKWLMLIIDAIGIYLAYYLLKNWLFIYDHIDFKV